MGQEALKADAWPTRAHQGTRVAAIRRYHALIVIVSEDVHVWLFFGTREDGSQTEPICFFAPQASI
jgi:hypothetical protein